jgi:hypothetical protein
LELKLSPSRRTSWGQFIVYLLRDVEKYLKNSNTPPTRFGREAVGDPRFVFDLRNGREPRQRTVEKVRAFLETIR